MKKENVAVIENHVYDFKCPLNYGYRDCDAVIPEIKKKQLLINMHCIKKKFP